MTTITERQGNTASSLPLGHGKTALGHRVAELLMAPQITAEQLLELNELVRQAWFELCSELTDFPRCGTVPDDLRRMHWERIAAAEGAMEVWLAGGDAKRALRSLAPLC